MHRYGYGMVDKGALSTLPATDPCNRPHPNRGNHSLWTVAPTRPYLTTSVGFWGDVTELPCSATLNGLCFF